MADYLPPGAHADADYGGTPPYDDTQPRACAVTAGGVWVHTIALADIEAAEAHLGALVVAPCEHHDQAGHMFGGLPAPGPDYS